MDSNGNIKIAHVLKDLDLGGIQTLLLDLLTCYQEKDIPCLFICIGTGVLKKDFERVHPEIYFIEKKLPYFDPCVIVKLRRLLLQEHVTLIHAHHTSEGIAALLATVGTDIRYVQSFHVAPGISNFQDNMVLRLLARKADLGICPSESQRQALGAAGYHTSGMKVVYNGVHPDRLTPHPGRDIRKELGILPEHLLLTSIGNFYNDTRDQLTICKALPAFFREYPEARFAFFGGFTNQYRHKPERYEACRAFCEQAGIADKTFFPGPEREIGSILAASSFFVYSSLGDTFGMAVTEAMLSGTPLILNDLPVLIEITGGPDHARFFPTRNPEILAQVMIQAVKTPQETIHMKERASIFATSRYLIAHHIQVLHQQYSRPFSPGGNPAPLNLKKG